MTNFARLSLFLLGLSLSATLQADATAKLLEELSNAHGPSGFEGPVLRGISRARPVRCGRVESRGLRRPIPLDARNIARF